MKSVVGVLSLWLMVCSGVWATDEVRVPESVAKTIVSRLHLANPRFVLGGVTASPVPGFYQVQVVDGPLLYVDETGSYVLTGKLYGVAPGAFIDLQDLALKPVRREKLAAIPASDEVIFPAKGKRKGLIYVFTDIDCGYCRKLHAEVPELNDLGIEVRYLAYPRAGVGSSSYTTIAKAWCADDRQTTLTRLKQGKSVNVAYCDDQPVADQFRLGGELGVRGTPAIFFEDGTLLPGYLPADEIARRLGVI